MNWKTRLCDKDSIPLQVFGKMRPMRGDRGWGKPKVEKPKEIKVNFCKT